MTNVVAEPRAGNFIAGSWGSSSDGETYQRANPWRPDETVGEFPNSSSEDLDLAIQAAERALPTWSGLPGAHRGMLLRCAADVIEGRAEQIARDDAWVSLPIAVDLGFRRLVIVR